MNQSISVAELVGRGVELRPFEAVAIARALIHAVPAAMDPGTPVGPPSLSTVRLKENGTVSCCSCGITPSVSEVAILLSKMLRQSGTNASGGLRYAIARGLLQVDAPPFDSVADFSCALQRYEEGEYGDVIRELWTRASQRGSSSDALILPHPERRKTMPSPTELRRQLREADRRIYELLTAEANAPVQQPSGAHRIRGWIKGATLGGLAAVVITALVMNQRTSPRTDGRLKHVVVDGIAPSTGGDKALAAGAKQESTHTTAGGAPSGETGSAVSLPRANDIRASTKAPNARATSRRALGAVIPTNAPSLVRAIDSDDAMFSPSFAADGTAIFFHTGRTQDPRSALMRVQDPSTNAVTEDLRVMTILEDGARNYHVQPSPDGTRIAFDSDRDGERGVYLADIDGTHVRRVSGSGYAAVPTWSPEGERLTFVRGEPDRPRVWNLWLHSLSTGEMVQVTSFRFGQVWGASWFPDGRRICYSHEDRLFVHDLAAGRSRQYASPIPGRLVRTPAVSPDGQRVIFQVARHGAWLLDLSNGSMRVVLTDPTAEEFAWSPDGRRVAFHSKRDGGWGIWFTAGS